MKSPLVSCLLLVLAFGYYASAQSGGKGSRNNTNNSSSTLGMPGNQNLSAMLLSGKVVLADGTSLTESAAIQTICKGQKHTETHTDSHGNFSFQFTSRISTVNSGMSNADASDDNTNYRGNKRDFRECELQAVLSGFTSEIIQLSSRLTMFESTDIGRV